MRHLLRPKSDLYVFGGYVLLALALAFNQFTVAWLQEADILPTPQPKFLHAHDLEIILPWLFDVFCVVVGLMMILAPRHLRYYLNDSLLFNLFLLSVLLGLMFSTNPLLPGRFRIFRIALVLMILFILTNALYLAVVKQREGRSVHSFYRNIAVVAYAVAVILLVLEIAFMFVLDTHRFNGTLASRGWFMRHWELNTEGYRDAEYDPAKMEGKKKLMVLGDSFVAGHGVEDPADRFSDRLGDYLDEEGWYTFNMGVGGSDVRDAFERLRAFPWQPDLLVFSYFPNDIESDGERAGLRLQRARSYNDVGFPIRYFVRRSYLLNYLYWRFPHQDELADYKGYIRQCYTHEPVLRLHYRHLGELADYTDSLSIPLVAVVFPFIEDAKGSAFATEPVVDFFRARGVPTVDVREMILDLPPKDIVVNRNDPHPNPHLHKLVADSLYAVLQRNGYLRNDAEE